MKKSLVFVILMILVISSVSFGASTRWNALGGEHRFIIDTTNYTLYPGRVTMFGNALFVIPVPSSDVKEFYDQRYFTDGGFVTGALFNCKNMTLAVHYNLDSDGTRNLRKALAGFLPDAQAVSDAQYDLRTEDFGTDDWTKANNALNSLNQKTRLSSMDVKTFPDIFWAMKTGKMSIGARLAIAMDNSSDSASLLEIPVKSASGAAVVGKDTIPVEEIKTSAKSFDFLVGATMYETPAGDVDLGLGIGKQSFSDDDPNSKTNIESTGGLDIAFNARLNKALCKDAKYMFVPIVNVNTGSLPSVAYNEISAPTVSAVSYMKGELGFGIREKIRDKGLAVIGLVGGYNATTTKPTITIVKDATRTKKERLETKDTTLVATILAGCEYPVNKWLIIRGGANMKYSKLNDEMIVAKKVENYVDETKNSSEDVLGSKKSDSFTSYYNVGIRTMYNGLLLDFLLARNLLHRGPYIISGASGGTWATHVCVTYMF
jgi:hypothetical protein